MTDVYNFIDKGLNNFYNLKILDFNSEIFNCCKELNELLNNFKGCVKYENHLENNSLDIRRQVEWLFSYFSSVLFINLEDVFELLNRYQDKTRIQGEKYRDHYYHSIQCFLLGISLYPLCKKLNNNIDNDKITLRIFVLCFYHDLGYLYKTRDEVRINETIKSWLLEIDQDSVLKIRRFNHFFYTDFDSSLISKASKTEELKSIWIDPYTFYDSQIISTAFHIKKSKDAEEHHSYESAVLLLRFSRTLDLIKCEGTVIPDGTIEQEDGNKKFFMEIIKSILFHDFKMDTRLSFSDNFWSCFLMLIDEIENYGRPYQNEQLNKKILLPTQVGMEITENNKIKLTVNEDYVNNLDPEIQDIYHKHTTQNIYKSLITKIEETDLNKILEL